MSETRGLRWLVYLWLLVMCIIFGVNAVDSWEVTGVQGYADTDPWLRLHKVERLHETGEWFNHRIERTNPPDGVISPWTRAMDVALLAGSLPFSQWMPFHDALFLWATWLPVLLLFVTALCGIFLLRSMNVSLIGWFAFGLVFLNNPLTYQQFFPTRVDHHGLLTTVFFAMAVALAGGLSSADKERRAGWIAGLWAGFGCWLSVEFLLPAGLACALLGGYWLFRGEFLTLLRAFLKGMLFFVLLGFVLEQRLQDYLLVEYDSLSIVHVVLLVLSVLGVEMLARMGQGALPQRVKVTTIALLAIGSAMAVLFPDFLLGPVAATDPQIRQIFLPVVAEMHTLFQWNKDGILWSYLTMHGLALLGYVIWGWHCDDPVQRRIAFGLAALNLLMFVFTVYQVRWGNYSLPLSCVGMALLVAAIYRALAGRSTRLALVAAALAALFCVAHPALYLMVSRGWPERSLAEVGDAPDQCNMEEARLIQQGRLSALLGPGVHTIWVEPGVGSQVLYWTPHRILASYYHRNTTGLLDMHDLIYAADAEAAKAIVEKRQIDAILFCRANQSEDAVELLRFAPDRAHVAKDRPFFNALSDGVLPDWLAPVDIPGEEDGNVLLLQVVKSESAGS